jgi:outer membrane protein
MVEYMSLLGRFIVRPCFNLETRSSSRHLWGDANARVKLIHSCPRQNAIHPCWSHCRRNGLCALVAAVLWASVGQAQSVPVSPERPWRGQQTEEFKQRLHSYSEPHYDMDDEHIYSLADLVDLAESHNPETRAGWQNAKIRGAELGIARSALYPAIAAVALASTTRGGVLLDDEFHRQTVGLFQPTLTLNYLVFDFGGRSGDIAEAKAELFAADFSFNDVHRRIIYQITGTYYRLLNAMGQEEAAKATLANAKAVQQEAESRLRFGLATLPDVLEARAATAQADYDLQANIGAVEIAQGDLSTTLGLPANSRYHVQGINDLAIPEALTGSADQAIDRAFEQRPDLMQQVANLRAADASLTASRSAYFPTLSFSGIGGLQRGYGRQDLLPDTYAEGETWNVQLTLQWNLFDGARREHRIAEAKARQARAKADIDLLRDQISDEVWAAYSNAKTALRQRQAASALLQSADRSYTAAAKSYDLGLRNLLDVVSAQRALAQARTADVTARTQVLTQLSNLAFRTGDLLRIKGSKVGP